MKQLLTILLIAFQLCACSDNAPGVVAGPGPSKNPSPAAPASNNEAVAVRMGMVFIDADPKLMGGGQIVRGSLSIGDRVELLTGDGRRIGARIDEIQDDATDAAVDTIKAPAGVFLTFTADGVGMAGSDNVLIAPNSFADFSAAKRFVDAIAEPDQPKISDQTAVARFGDVTMTINERSLRMIDPQPMLRTSAMATSNLLDFVWDGDGYPARSPTRPTDHPEAKREVATKPADQAVTLSISAGINDVDGEVLTLDLLLPVAALTQLAQLPQTFEFSGTPSPLPGDGLSAFLRDGQVAYDASRATVTLTAFDASNGKFEGTFNATLVARPKDLFSGTYDMANSIEIRNGSFRVDLRQPD